MNRTREPEGTPAPTAAAPSLEQQLEAARDQIGDGIIVTDAEGKVGYLNRPAEILTGWTNGDARNRPVTEVCPLFRGPGMQPVPHPVSEVLQRGEPAPIPADSVLRRRDGETVPVEEGAIPFRVGDRIEGALLVFRDATDRVRAEEALNDLCGRLEGLVQERTEEWQSINKDLESFTQAVSHDLRSPLRAITGFGTLLQERHGPRLDAEGNRWLTTVRDSARRLSQMVDDFLTLSRVGQQHLKPVPVDMANLVQGVLAEIPAEKAEVQVGSLPSVEGDAQLLRQVWSILLSNAFKFSRGQTPARIEVGGQEEGSETVYSVRDNGVGFDMEFSDRLFETFKRLHAAEQFEGIGANLSIARKIVQRHRGRIWADSRPGGPTVFSFALPRLKR